MRLTMYNMIIISIFSLTACGGGDGVSAFKKSIDQIIDGVNSGEWSVQHNIKYGDQDLQYGIAVPKGNGQYEIRFADQDNIDFYNYCAQEIDPTGYWVYHKEINVGVSLKVDTTQVVEDYITGQGVVYGFGAGGLYRSDLGAGTYEILTESDTKITGWIDSEYLHGKFLAYKCSKYATNKRLESVQWSKSKEFSVVSEYNYGVQGRLKLEVFGPTYSDISEVTIDLEHLERPTSFENSRHYYEEERFKTSSIFYLLGEKLYSCNRTPVGVFTDEMVEYSIRGCDNAYEKSVGVFKLEYIDILSENMRLLYNDVNSDYFVISR